MLRKPLKKYFGYDRSGVGPAYQKEVKEKNSEKTEPFNGTVSLISIAAWSN
jgi:hypothetical protein